MSDKDKSQDNYDPNATPEKDAHKQRMDDLFGDLGDDEAELSIEDLIAERDELQAQKLGIQQSIAGTKADNQELSNKLQGYADAVTKAEAKFAIDKKQTIQQFADDVAPVITAMNADLATITAEDRASDTKYDKLVQGFEKTLIQLPAVFNKHGIRKAGEAAPATTTPDAPATTTATTETETPAKTTPADTAIKIDTVESLNIECDTLMTDITKLGKELALLEAEARNLYKKVQDGSGNIDRVQAKLESDRPYAIQKFVSDFLPVVDTMELGLDSISPKLRADKKYAALAEDFQSSLDKLKVVFNKYGVKEINPLGEEFDMTKHEALATVPAADVDSDMVVKVSLKGYQIADRVIRPAKVVVSQ